MKKILNILFITFVCVLLCACGKEEVVGGKTAEINLDGNATTGYEWKYSLSDETLLNVVENEYVPNEAPEEMVGVGGIQKYVFKGLKEGEVIVTLTYSQPWDTVTEPVYTLKYTFKVDKNNNISLVKKEGTYSSETLPDVVFE